MLLIARLLWKPKIANVKNFQIIAKAEKWSVINYTPSDFGKKKLITKVVFT